MPLDLMMMIDSLTDEQKDELFVYLDKYFHKEQTWDYWEDKAKMAELEIDELKEEIETISDINRELSFR